MDAETRDYLDRTLGAFRDDVRREIGTLREEIGTLGHEVGTLRGEAGTLGQGVGTLRGEVGILGQGVGTLRGEVGTLGRGVGTLREEVGTLGQEVGALRGEFGAFRQDVRDTAAETRRHFDVVAEYIRHDVLGLAEGVIALSERVDRLGIDRRGEMNERFAATHAVVRVAFQEVRRDIGDLSARL